MFYKNIDYRRALFIHTPILKNVYLKKAYILGSSQSYKKRRHAAYVIDIYERIFASF